MQWRDDTTLPSRGLGRRPIYQEAPRMKKCCVSGEGTLSNFPEFKSPPTREVHAHGVGSCRNSATVTRGGFFCTVQPAPYRQHLLYQLYPALSCSSVIALTPPE